MKRKFIYLFLLCCSAFSAFSQDTPYIAKQGATAQNASAWINGRFTSHLLQTYQNAAASTVLHYNMMGGSNDSPAGGNLRWSFTLQGIETGNNAGSDFKLLSFKDNGTENLNPFSITRSTGIVSIPVTLATPLIQTNNSAGALSIIGGATTPASYRGAEIGLRGGTYGTTPGEMSFHTGTGGGGTSQPERMRIDVNGLVSMKNSLSLTNPTSNNILFVDAGLGAPTLTDRSPGTKIILLPAVSAANVDYAFGLERNTGNTESWFSMPSNSPAHSLKFYGGIKQVARIDGVGNNQWEGQGRFKGWLTGTAATGLATEIGVTNGVATIIGCDRSAAPATYIPLTLAGGTTNNNQTNVTINEVGVGIGTNTFFGKLSIYDPNNGKASISIQSASNSRFWINESNNILKIGATGGATPPALGAINITSPGFVGIGTANPQSELSVKGTITAQRVKVTQTGWADYVFNKDYLLTPLTDVEKYVNTHQHLEGIPSAAAVAKDGIDVGEMNKKLLEKVEELMLYLIEQNKKIAALEEWKVQQEKRKNF